MFRLFKKSKQILPTPTQTNGVGVILWSIDTEGKILISEGNALSRLGLKPGQLVGQSVFEVYKKNTKVTELIRRGLSGEEFNDEVELGGVTWSNYYVPRREGEKIVGLLGVTVDITPRKEAEKKLLELQSNRYQALLDSLPMGIYRTTGREGRLVEVNNALVAMAEASSKEELMQHSVIDFYQNREDRAFFAKKMFEDGFVRDEEVQLVSLKGRKALVSMSATIERAENGEVYFNGIVEDISERKQLEERVKAFAEERFKVIFENASDGLVLADIETHQLSSGNRAFCRMLGYSPEEVQNLHLSDIHPAEDFPYILTQFERQARGEIVLARDLRVKKKDGSIFYVDVSTSTISFDDKNYLLGSFRDVTERKESEKKEQEQIDELKQMNKLMIDRELKMVELKNEIEQLKKKV